jgi:hypothetical protein
VVNSIFISEGRLYSGGYDGSVKMWNIERAVELQSFRAFDDSVAVIHSTFSGLLLGITNDIIHISQQTNLFIKIVNIEKIIGYLQISNTVYVATKSFRSLYIREYSLLTAALDASVVKFKIGDTCSAFFSQLNKFLFWFALRDGSIVQFLVKDSKFNVLQQIRSNFVILDMCASNELLTYLTENNVVSSVDITTGIEKDSFTGLMRN